MIGCKQITRLGELSSFRKPLIHVLEVNIPPPHVVHKNPIECPPMLNVVFIVDRIKNTNRNIKSKSHMISFFIRT